MDDTGAAMKRRLLAVAAALGCVMLLSGHVGNDVEYLVGKAGPYPVQVVIRLPGVIPGQAQLSVQVDADDVTGVAVQPFYWRAVEHAPAPERARLVPGETRLWSTDVWLMARGSYGVRVVVTGARGEGEIMMPVSAVATRTLEMQRSLGLALAGLGLFLVAGLITIVRAAASDGLLPPGVEPDRRTRRRSWIATGVATVVITGALLGGSAWWRSVDADYRAGVTRSIAVSTQVEQAQRGRLLTLNITDPNFLQGTPLIPDHGKIMHLFLVREPELDVFAHLHPVRTDSLTFSAHLPPIPEGRYRLYADIVRASGYVFTLQDQVEISPASGDETHWLEEDADASWLAGATVQAETAALEDGGTMTLSFDGGAPRAGRPTSLRVAVHTPDGSPGALEPYLGMMGHSVVTRPDGSLFVHLHPVGTVSMAALEQFERRTRGDTALVADVTSSAQPSPASLDPHAAHAAAASPGTVDFPFVFPAEGTHRIWIQVRRGGRNLTGAYDVEVAPSPDR